MKDWTDNNIHINRILEAMQPLEEISGPEESKYLAVLSYLKDEIETRLKACVEKNKKSSPEEINRENFEHRISLDYVNEVIQRTGWNKDTVIEVLHGLHFDLFVPSDRQYYLEKISPF
jgi:hypothetical protein